MQYRMGKRISAILLALIMTAALSGCSGNKTASRVSSAAESSSESSSAASSEASSAVSSGEASGTSAVHAAYSEGLTADGYFEGITALDLVTLPDYKTMEIPEDISTVSDEDLKSEIDSRLSSYAASEQIKDRDVKDGDTVNIDYVGSVDGVEFAGGSTQGQGTDVTIGVTSYIDDFLEQLIGHKPGETIDVEVTFPEPYENNPDLSGKDAVFVTTINYIVEKVTPELTDDFVSSNWKASKGWSTVAEANEGIREELRSTAVSNYLWQEIQEQAEISEVPATVQTYQEEAMKNYYTALASQYGMEVEDLLKNNLQVDSMDELVKQNREQLDTNAKSSLIMQALCEDMGVKPADEDIAAYFKSYLNVEDYSDYETEYGRPYLCLLAREDIAKQKLGERE